MAITISGLKARSFIDSPLVVKVEYSNAFPSGATLRKIHVGVISTYQGTTRKHVFSMEESGGSVCVDISSALRSTMFGRDALAMYKNDIARLGKPGTTVSIITSTYEQHASDMATFLVTAYVSYVIDGFYEEGLWDGSKFTEGAYQQSATCKAFFGGVSEMDRYLGTEINLNQSGDVVLSSKPASGEVVSDNHIFIVPVIHSSGNPGVYTFLRRFSIDNRKGLTMKITDSLTRTAYNDLERPRVEFLFVNRYGGMEDASALCAESLEYEIERKTYERVSPPSLFIPDVSLVSSRVPFHAKWEMSSGSVSREWAEWWAGEFLTAEQHWMKLTSARLGSGAKEDVWIPVVVTPKSSDTEVYDRSKSDALHIDFTVQPAHEGRI